MAAVTGASVNRRATAPAARGFAGLGRFIALLEQLVEKISLEPVQIFVTGYVLGRRGSAAPASSLERSSGSGVILVRTATSSPASSSTRRGSVELRLRRPVAQGSIVRAGVAECGHQVVATMKRIWL
jgi:hypothetical protein